MKRHDAWRSLVLYEATLDKQMKGDYYNMMDE